MRPQDGWAAFVSHGTPGDVGAYRSRDLSMPDFISKFDLIAKHGRRAVWFAREPLITPSIYKSLIFQIRESHSNDAVCVLYSLYS